MAVAEMLREKKHMLVFLTGVGEFVIATDNINEIANEGWFREFLQLHGPPRVTERPQPQPQSQAQQPLGPPPMPPPNMRQQQRQQGPEQFDMRQRPPTASQVPPSSFLDIEPDKMSKDYWESMSDSQQQQWMQRWNINQ